MWPRAVIDHHFSLDWPRSAIAFLLTLRGAKDGQLSLTWPRNAIAFLFANFARGLAVPEMVNSLLIDLDRAYSRK